MTGGKAAARCEICCTRLADMAATFGADRCVRWCETCAGPALAQLVYHYTVTVRPVQTAVPDRGVTR
ncbi:hypothetical protein [Microcystis phage Mwe-JY05]